MMMIPDYRADSAPAGSRRRKWIRAFLILAVTLGLGAASGFALARGMLNVPSSLASRIPEPIRTRLTIPGAAPATQAPALLTDYGFELLDPAVKQGEAVLSVRLLQKSSGKPVSDAVIYSQRLDMAPEGMAAMTADLAPAESGEAGVYRFKTDLTMEGRWQLLLAAKVQGEVGTVQGKLMLKAAAP